MLMGGGTWICAFAIQAKCDYSGTATAGDAHGDSTGVPAALPAACAAAGLIVFWLTAVRSMRALPELCRPKQWNGNGADEGGTLALLRLPGVHITKEAHE